MDCDDQPWDLLSFKNEIIETWDDVGDMVFVVVELVTAGSVSNAELAAVCDCTTSLFVISKKFVVHASPGFRISDEVNFSNGGGLTTSGVDIEDTSEVIAADMVGVAVAAVLALAIDERDIWELIVGATASDMLDTITSSWHGLVCTTTKELGLGINISTGPGPDSPLGRGRAAEDAAALPKEEAKMALLELSNAIVEAGAGKGTVETKIESQKDDEKATDETCDDAADVSRRPEDCAISVLDVAKDVDGVLVDEIKTVAIGREDRSRRNARGAAVTIEGPQVQ
ncbi:hypothetical protein EJ08DRAFT_662963 [Tothia fuscella]|uniref:Uncharacterized protein n=1 Tax=Tothia fuscella TaxID=1048955 RepID=A0A9P4NLS3_9PEZI|nr:hypothetical protein EJ08DRAFT_662963 [Tothia fuscella]